MTAPHVVYGDPTTSNGADMYDFGPIPSASVNLNPSSATASDVGGHQRAQNRVARGIMAEATLTLNDLQAANMNAILTDAQPHLATEAVTGVDTTNSTFTVAGDITGALISGMIIEVEGSTGNDGTYTVDSFTYDSTADETTITVEGSISDTTADGDLLYANGGLEFRTDVRIVNSLLLAIIPQAAIRDMKHNGTAVIDNPRVWWFVATRETDFGEIPYEDSEGEDANPDVDATFQALLAEEDLAGSTLPQGAKKVFRNAPTAFNLSWSLPDFYSPNP